MRRRVPGSSGCSTQGREKGPRILRTGLGVAPGKFVYIEETDATKIVFQQGFPRSIHAFDPSGQTKFRGPTIGESIGSAFFA